MHCDLINTTNVSGSMGGRLLDLLGSLCLQGERMQAFRELFR